MTAFRIEMKMPSLHPWNRDPLEKSDPPEPVYRLQVRHRHKASTKLSAYARGSTDKLLDLRNQLEAIDYEFVKLELVEDASAQ